jgi:hypothetical protein
VNARIHSHAGMNQIPNLVGFDGLWFGDRLVATLMLENWVV